MTEPTGEPPRVDVPTSETGALALELSCRYVQPLLEVARPFDDELRALLAFWQVTVEQLRDETNWVSLRFCEALVEWLAARVGRAELIERVTQLAYSPRALGFLYPLLRAFGSPRIGYARLPQFVGVLNKVSRVSVVRLARGRVELEYRPATPALREASPLICELRRAQLAAGPTLWRLPPATVEERECQARGGERCLYHVAWVEPIGWRCTLVGAGAGALLGFGAMPSFAAAVATVAAFALAGRLWDSERQQRELRAFNDEQRRALTEAADAIERRFVELQEAKQKVDEQVEARTAELRVLMAERIQREKLATLGALAAGIAHEVRNPVGAILAGLPRLRRDLESGSVRPAARQMLDVAIDSAERINRLVGDLLELGQPDREGPAPWNVHDGLEAAVRMLGHRAPEAVAIERDYRLGHEVPAHAATMNQVLLNVLDNALAAVGERGTVRIETRDQEGGALIAISDSGAGVAPELRDRIFDPFFTSKPVGKGTGLGLHIARRIMNEHGGTIDVIPSTLGGACFRIWLPAHGRAS